MTDTTDSDRASITGNHDVIVIGGGPAGLAAATELKRLGVQDVVVLERESEAGGIPRHCGHPPFGMREFTRVLTGPRYAARMVERACDAGVAIHTSTTVVEVNPCGKLLVTNGHGTGVKTARRIIVATGVRETPRSARLISGSRPHGVINTGALQSMIYLKNRTPFKRPVIIGTELVSFSAIMTCRHAKIRPAAMIEEAGQVTARWPSSFYPKVRGIPIHLNTRLLGIEGGKHVCAVRIEDNAGHARRIECDGVILTGKFTPEAALARCGHLAVSAASGGPDVDQFGRCSDPAYFATGNVLRPVETAGWSWSEGLQSGRWVADDLAGKLPAHNRELQITTTGPVIKFAMPQRISLPYASSGMRHLQLRFTRKAKGELVAFCGGEVIWRKQMNVRPERRFLISIDKLAGGHEGGQMELRYNEGGH